MKYVHATKEFARLARRSGVADADLLGAVSRAEEGKVDADLGGGLIKQRLARPDEGRSSGFRTIIAYRRGERAVFLHMFAKSKRGNLTRKELAPYQKLAKMLSKLDDEQLDALVDEREWRKIER
jgi:hypothetical protein